ncbi:MAG TPA: hypothetical protein VM101_04095 [Flavitalea sp.]|nr:hypothetical protein [Flavitalea sp.]
MDNKKSIQNPETRPNGGPRTAREEIEKAHRQAEHDISADPEFSAHSPNDDLDEGETARLGEEKTGLI